MGVVTNVKNIVAIHANKTSKKLYIKPSLYLANKTSLIRNFIITYFEQDSLKMMIFWRISFIFSKMVARDMTEERRTWKIGTTYDKIGGSSRLMTNDEKVKN